MFSKFREINKITFHDRYDHRNVSLRLNRGASRARGLRICCRQESKREGKNDKEQKKEGRSCVDMLLCSHLLCKTTGTNLFQACEETDRTIFERFIAPVQCIEWMLWQVVIPFFLVSWSAGSPG